MSYNIKYKPGYRANIGFWQDERAQRNAEKAMARKRDADIMRAKAEELKQRRAAEKAKKEMENTEQSSEA